MASVNEDMTVRSCLANSQKGFTIGNRLVLPFFCNLISITVGLSTSLVAAPDFITNFSRRSEDVAIHEEAYGVSIYFLKHKDLRKELGQYRGHILILCCEKSDSIFDESSHVTLKLNFKDNSSQVIITKVE